MDLERREPRRVPAQTFRQTGSGNRAFIPSKKKGQRLLPLSAMQSFRIKHLRSPRFAAEQPGPNRYPRARRRWRSLLGVGAVVLGCSSEPILDIGEWECSGEPASEVSSASDFEIIEDDVEIPWQTSFENGFCDYTRLGGFCFANAAASFEVVSSPVHSGNWAAAFHIVGEDVDGLQARCARQGRLPESAYYGAWFYIPSAVTVADNWNLFHFEGEPPDGSDQLWGLWDVSLEVGPDGSLRPFVYDFLRPGIWSLPDSRRVPIGQWFHLEAYLRRASDTTGQFTLYLDGDQVLDLTDTATDDTEFGQWYVGNLATTIEPTGNTLFVDDVTISMVRQGAS